MHRVLALAVAMLFTACAEAQTGVQPQPSPAPSPIPSPSQPSAVLVFQVVSPPNVHFSLVAANGTVLRTVDTTAGGGSPWQGESAALLLSGANQAHSVLAKDGTIAAFPQALNRAFDIAAPEGIGGTFGDPILLDSNTALGLAGYGSAKYELIDLRSGQISTLLTVVRTQPTGGIQPSTVIPLGTSVDRHIARVLVRHATANGTNVPGFAVVEMDLGSKTVTSIRQLPTPVGFDAFSAIEAAVSADGRLMAYQENSKANAQSVAIYTIHVVDIGTGRDIAMADTSIATGGNSRGLRFSPDGTALLVYGISAPALGPRQESRLAVFASTDNHSLATFNLGDSSYNNISPVGWIGDHTLVYTITTTSIFGNFTNGTQSAHTLDVLSGERHDLPAGLGELIAVLS